MRRMAIRAVLGVAVLAATAAGRDAAAQGVGGGSAAPMSGPMINPYMSPYANPYLNPALTVGSTNRNDALLYLWAAQQQPGGLLAGPASAPGAGSVRGRSAAIGAGGASRYYQRNSPRAVSSAVGRFQDHGRYFGNTGR